MGNPTGRVPGPLGKPIGGVAGAIGTATALLRDLKLIPVEEPPGPWAATLSPLDPARVVQALRDIYGQAKGPVDDSDKGGNIHDPAVARLPSSRREGDATRPAPALTVRLKDPEWSAKYQDSKLSGEVAATLEIPSPRGPKFDSPTQIRLGLSSVHLGSEDLSLGGSARAYKVFKADWKLRLHYDPAALLAAAVRAARDRGISRGAVEEMLEGVSFDFSAVLKAGLPLSWVRLSASSLLPLPRPLLGATDRLLPVEVASLPDSRLLMLGGLLLPSGVVFDSVVPGFGVHFSEYGARRGGSATLGGVSYVNPTKIGKAGVGQVFPVFGYLDLKYVQRVSDTVDLSFGLTYSYSPSSGDDPAAPGPEYLPGLRPGDFRGTKYQSWNPTSSENMAPDQAVSKHRLMFRIEGTHDLLGGNRN